MGVLKMLLAVMLMGLMASSVAGNYVFTEDLLDDYLELYGESNQLLQSSGSGDAIRLYRAQILKQEINKINRHNNKRNPKWTEKLTPMSGLSDGEFQQRLGLLQVPSGVAVLEAAVSEEVDKCANKRNEARKARCYARVAKREARKKRNLDWVASGIASSSVKDQGRCGNCWAFSATGGLESLYKQEHGANIVFSDQQLTSCSSSYGNGGCNGGIMRWAFNYVRDHGITEDSNYPLTSDSTGQTGSCTHVSLSSDYKIHGYKAGNTCATLLNYLMERPVSVALDASNWKNYGSGIYECRTQGRINHAVLLVGTTKRHYRIRNSWGTGWGDGGFATIHRRESKNCQICSQFSVPISLTEAAQE